MFRMLWFDKECCCARKGFEGMAARQFCCEEGVHETKRSETGLGGCDRGPSRSAWQSKALRMTAICTMGTQLLALPPASREVSDAIVVFRVSEDDDGMNRSGVGGQFTFPRLEG